jgi:hypothetical protein
MRKTTLMLNSFVVVFFFCFLAYTFIARQHLDSLARGFVTEKTLDYSKPVVEIAEEAIDSPWVKRVLTDEQATAIRNEIADYRNDPSGYVSVLTRQHVLAAPMENAGPLVETAASIKKKVRLFYDNTLNALIADLRIFSLSNLIAGLVAFVLAYRSLSEIHKPIVWFSFLMFVAVLYCSYMYVDGLTFFRVLFRTHMGWWYAALLCVMIVALYVDYGRHTKEQNQELNASDHDGMEA